MNARDMITRIRLLVTDFETSEKLQEIGIPQDSVFYWHYSSRAHSPLESY